MVSPLPDQFMPNFGEGGNDRLDGNQDDDRLIGGQGDDLLIAGFIPVIGSSAGTLLGQGRDVLAGNAGSDEFNNLDGVDVILDFNPADDTQT